MPAALLIGGHSREAARPADCDFMLEDIGTSGRCIRVSRGGASPPLLLVHGQPPNHVTWCKAAQRFAEHYTIAAIDLRGYGIPAHRRTAPITSTIRNARWRRTSWVTGSRGFVEVSTFLAETAL